MYSKHLQAGNQRKLKIVDWIGIGCVWLILQMILLKFLGINDTQESLKYIGLADKWVTGDRNFQWYNLFYSGYIAMHILLKDLGLPPKSMYLVQLLISGVALYYFVQILTLLLKSRFTIIISAILYASCFIIHQWVTALFTDSVFCNLLIISTYFLMVEENSLTQKILCWTFILIIPFFRPVGFLFLILVSFYWVTMNLKRNRKKIIFCFAYLIFIGFIIYKSLLQSADYFYPLHNIQANIICGYPSNLLKYQTETYKEGMGIFTYLFDNPAMSIRLFFSRFFKVFSLGRPYYSSLHNMVLFASTFIYFILAICGLISIIIRKKKHLLFLLVGVLLFSLPCVAFCLEWNGRFSLPVFCYVLLLSGIGVDWIYNLTRSASS